MILHWIGSDTMSRWAGEDVFKFWSSNHVKALLDNHDKQRFANASWSKLPFPPMTSRADLLGWLNELLQINYTKVEQCGSGAAYCQVIDSIYGETGFKHLHRTRSNQVFCLFSDLLSNVFRRRPNDKGKNECKTRVRIYSKFQSNAKCIQSKENRQGTWPKHVLRADTYLRSADTRGEAC